MESLLLIYIGFEIKIYLLLRNNHDKLMKMFDHMEPDMAKLIDFERGNIGGLSTVKLGGIFQKKISQGVFWLYPFGHVWHGTDVRHIEEENQFITMVFFKSSMRVFNRI